MTGARPSDHALVASDQAAARLDPTGFDPSRECNLLDQTQQICPRHGHSHSPDGIAPPQWFLSEKDTNITRDILAADGSVVCSVWNVRHPWMHDNRPTTRLILAAPQLLCAAIAAFDFLGGVDGAAEIRDELLATINAASAIEARSATTAGRGPKDESAVPQADAPDTPQ